MQIEGIWSNLPKPKKAFGGKKLTLISLHVPKVYLKLIDELVELGLYPSRAEAIRVAIRDLIHKDREMVFQLIKRKSNMMVG